MSDKISSRQANEAARIAARYGRTRARGVRDGALLLDVLGDAGAYPTPAFSLALAHDGRVIDHIEHEVIPEPGAAAVDAFDQAVLEALPDWTSLRALSEALAVSPERLRPVLVRLCLFGVVQARGLTKNRRYRRVLA